MRFLAKWLRKLAEFIQPAGDLELKNRAKQAIKAADNMNVSGEYKRHQVLALLKKNYPNVRTRDLAYLIETIIQDL